jgi:hypothetical protein
VSRIRLAVFLILLAGSVAAALGVHRRWQIDICLGRGGSWQGGTCQFASPPGVDLDLAKIAGDWVEVSTGEHLLLWPDGHYGERNIVSKSTWTLFRPGHIGFSFCFGSREIDFHFERQALVVENGYEAGRYQRVGDLKSAALF